MTEKQFDDEIALKDVINTFWEYFWHMLRSWIFIGFMVILFVIYNIYSTVTHDTNYIAPITFMINEDESSSLGGIGSLLGSFGGLLGGGSEFNLDKILEISTSNNLGEDVLLNKVTINGKEDYIANHLIISKDTLQEWIEFRFLDNFLLDDRKRNIKQKQKDFRFVADTIDYSDRIQTSIVKKCYSTLFGNEAVDGMVTTEFGELTGIMKLETKSYNETLSIAITESLFEALKTFYIEKSIEKQQQTYNIMKAKHDSIRTKLASLDYTLANYEDTKRGLFRKTDKLKKEQLQRNIAINTMALGKAKENLEISDFALRDKTPFVQVIDNPFPPLLNTKPSIVRSVVIGGFLGGFLGVLLVGFRKIYKDIMK